MEPDNELTGRAIEVHRTLGLGLLEAVYEACLFHELAQAGMEFVRQRRLPVGYKGHPIECDLKIDVIVEQILIAPREWPENGLVDELQRSNLEARHSPAPAITPA